MSIFLSVLLPCRFETGPKTVQEHLSSEQPSGDECMSMMKCLVKHPTGFQSVKIKAVFTERQMSYNVLSEKLWN